MLFQDELKRVLDPDRWREVNRRLLAKMLSEYMYEDIIKPDFIETEDGINRYELRTAEDKVYRFAAKPRMFDSLTRCRRRLKSSRADNGQTCERD
ncbi:hypothetical protein PO124_10910 [Bacillus licheniformis]|nr:hypothetical protein [Bacillus licheniformis]